MIGDSADRRVEILADDDALHATWSRFGPGRDGADLHIHHRHSDLFYILQGELTVALGADGVTAAAPAGTLVSIPPLVVHGFRNAGERDVRYLNFHAPGEGFADYLRARRDGLEGSFDQADPPDDGGRSPEAASSGRGRLVEDGSGLLVTRLVEMEEIGIDEIRIEPGSTLPPFARRARLLCLYVLEGTLALTGAEHEVMAETGTWVQLPPGSQQPLACAGPEPVRVLRIHA